MSRYMFNPDPLIGSGEEPYATWHDGFTDCDISNIIQLGENRNLDKAMIGGRDYDDNYTNIRISKTSWIELSNDTQWLYDKLAYIARQLNAQFYKYNLFGFNEHFQYTVYDGSENGHYSWHMDSGVGKNMQGESPRKFTMVLQLTDPSEYEGGQLQLFTSTEPTDIPKEKGMVAVFPSYTLHRVTPVTSGIRRTLVVWVTGPAFK